MIIIRPDRWLTGTTGPIPQSLLSGSRAVWLTDEASVFGLTKAGVPSAILPVSDYVRLMKLYPGPSGGPTHEIPAQFDVAV
jgi:hypothetical protein